MAAGYGTRLYPLTKDIPKPLLDVAGKPIVQYLLDKIAKYPIINEVLLVTNDKFFQHFVSWRNKIQSHYESLKIKVINDETTTPESRLGAIGDIQFAVAKEAIQESLLIIGGDNIFDWGLKDFIVYAKRKRSIVMGVYDIIDKNLATHYGVVSLNRNKKLMSFEEKPQNPKSSYVAMCLYYFPKDKLKDIKIYLEGEHNKKDAVGNYFDWLHKMEDIYAYVFKGNWFDIGNHIVYKKAEEYFSKLN